MSDIQRYLLEFDRSRRDATAVAAQSAQRLQKGELKLLQLIEELGEYLNDQDAAVRGKTMAYLAEVLANVPPKVLSLQQRNLLCDFVLSRLEDTEGIGSCAKALMALEQLGKWDNERAATVMQTFLDQTHPLRQFKQQSGRYPVLQLIDLLMTKYRDALRKQHEDNEDFLPRFIAYFEGEKDPRNLMVVFSILKVPMTEWTIGPCAQDLFDAVFNYFPITFRPPPDDPYGITAQDLKDRLRECISSTSEFASYAFPALLDKLDSTSMNTKRDVLQAIISAVQKYGPRTIALYSITLWDSLKFEILNVQEEDLAVEALNGLAEIAKTLSQGTDGSLRAYLTPITKECNEHLEDAPTKQSEAAARILRKIAGASAGADKIVSVGVIPRLFELYQTADTLAKRRGLLEVLAHLIRASTEVYGDWRSIGTAGEMQPVNGLLDFRDQVLIVLHNGLKTAPVKEVSFRLVCLDGLLQLSKVRQLLNDEDIGRIIELFHTIVINEESYGKDEVKAAAINGLVEIAHQKPQVIVDKAFPAFLAELPDSDANGSREYVPVLEAFAKLASEEKVFDTVALRLKNKFAAAVAQKASSTYIAALLSALLYALNQGARQLEENSESASYYQDIALPLLQRASSIDASHPEAFNDETILDLVGRICNVIIRSRSVELQNQVIPELYTLFRKTPQDQLPPFKVDSPPEQTKTMIVSTHLLASFRKEATLPFELQLLISSLVDFSQQPHLSTPVRSASLRQMSLLLNKYIPSASFKKGSEGSFPVSLFMPLFASESLDPNRIRIIFAFLKALLLRNAPILSTLYPSLLQFLSDTTHGLTVARAFTTLLQPDDLLTKSNHASINGLHKQKAFAMLVPSITAAFRTASAETKPNYLIALSGILRWIPFDIVVEEISALVPLLLQSLDLRGEEVVKEAAIGTLDSIIREKPKLVEEHAGSLIARLLENTTPKPSRKPQAAAKEGEGTTTPRVRVAALKCLQLVPQKFRTEVVLPYRRQTVKQLTKALDDRRREVRYAAVRCRTQWLEVDEVEDDE